MSKVCEICGKRPIYGNSVSHAHNKTRRRWEPNLTKVRIEINGTVKTAKVCTACLKKGNIKKAS
ncbi:MAG: 50S ribosomal protein L28 [Fidelibacterota bacterium]